MGTDGGWAMGDSDCSADFRPYVAALKCARRFDAIPYAFIPLPVLRSDRHRDLWESQFASVASNCFWWLKL
jgi:hypothetical protein